MKQPDNSHYHEVIINERKYFRSFYANGSIGYALELKNGLRRRITTSHLKAQIDQAIVEADHSEALEMNRQFNIDGINAARRQSQHRNASPERQARWLEQDHAEALEMNRAFDV